MWNMPLLTKKILLMVLCFVVSNTNRCQVIYPGLRSTSLTTDDGLSQGSNYFRYEDSRGFMWLTGNDALNRFDGNTVKVYNLAKYFNGCPALQQGYGFAEDAESNIYIGSTRGLYIYHRRKEQFSLCKIFSAPDSVAMPFAYRDGKIWCFNRAYQLATYDVATHQITILYRLLPETLPSVHIYNLSGNPFYYRLPVMDEQGRIWIAGVNDIAVWNSRTGQPDYPFRSFLQKLRPVIFNCNFRAGKIVCGTSKGILTLDIHTGQAKVVEKISGQRIGKVYGLACNDSCIAFNSELGLGFITWSYNRVQWVKKRSKTGYSKLFHLSFDRMGRLWACDDGVGLLIFNLRPWLLGRLPEEREADLYKLGSGSHTFGELPNGEIMIRHDVLFNRYERRLRAFPYPSVGKSALSSYRLCTDRFRKGIWMYEDAYSADSKLRYMHFFTERNLQTVLTETAGGPLKSAQNDMVELPDSRLMCSFDEGLYWFKSGKRLLEKIPGTLQHAFKINLLSNNRVAVSYLNADMLLYKVLPGDSLQLLRSILPGVQAFYIAEDTIRHRYWAATNAGIYLFGEDFKPLRHFDANNGLAGTYIYGLLLDDAGNAWCSHQRGLSRIDAQHFQLINFDKSDGIQDWDFHNRAFFKSADGTLYFGGAKGVNFFKPPLVPEAGYRPEVYVDEILAGGRPYLPDTNANYITELQLRYTDNDVTVKALVKDLAEGRSRQLLYRLAETDTAWRILPNGSVINFNQLAPGTYTLELGINDKYTAEKKVQKTIRIRIAAPFYRKAWFWALVAVVLTGLFFRYFSRRKLAKQRIKFQEQLALAKQRQKITADLHDDIGASLSSLQINSAVAGQLLQSDRAGAAAILSKIEMQAHAIAEKMGDIVWSMKPGTEELMSLSSRIKNFAGELLEVAHITWDIVVAPEIDSHIEDMAVRKNLLLIVKEAINNAAKYSRASTVSISLQYSGGKVQLKVTDNGVGFDTRQAKGNGIDNMRRRAAELGGVLTVTTTPGGGTTVSGSIPIIP
jgi:signal transduction histidine kinase